MPRHSKKGSSGPAFASLSDEEIEELRAELCIDKFAEDLWNAVDGLGVRPDWEVPREFEGKVTAPEANALRWFFARIRMVVANTVEISQSDDPRQRIARDTPLIKDALNKLERAHETFAAEVSGKWLWHEERKMLQEFQAQSKKFFHRLQVHLEDEESRYPRAGKGRPKERGEKTYLARELAWLVRDIFIKRPSSTQGGYYDGLLELALEKSGLLIQDREALARRALKQTNDSLPPWRRDRS